MAEQSYKRPPITEVVIDVRFASPLDADALAKIKGAYSSHYPQEGALRNIQLQVTTNNENPTAQLNQLNQAVGYKRNSLDQTEIVILWPVSLIISQLAPYPGWDSFFERFHRDWAIWKKEIGYRKISRVGIRYINRIDIPGTGPIVPPSTAPVVEHEKFLNIYPQLPDALGPTIAYGLQAQLPIMDIGCMLTINAAAVPSPLMNHASFVVDIDIAKTEDVPQNDAALYELLSAIRIKKNFVFEECITDRARELFQK